MKTTLSLMTCCCICCICGTAFSQKNTYEYKNTWPEKGKNAKDSIVIDPENPFTIIINGIDNAAKEKLLKSSYLLADKDMKTSAFFNDKIFDEKAIVYAADKKTLTLNVLTMVKSTAKEPPFSLRLAKDSPDGNDYNYTLTSKPAKKVGKDTGTVTPTINAATEDFLTDEQLSAYFEKHYKDYRLTDVGYKKADENYRVHIFLDQLGNVQFSSLPTGIQKKYHYVIHILYPKHLNATSRYAVKVTGGSLTDNIVNNNGSIQPSKAPAVAGEHAETGKEAPGKDMTIVEKTFEILPTSDNLTFNIAMINGGSPISYVLLNTYTITKTPFYMGSFDVGVLYTWISNPTFTSVNAPGDATKQTLKITDNKPAIIGTFMYTLYLSPWNVFFPKGKSGIKYKTVGRSYLDDEGGVMRKIYPCIGVGLSKEILTNWFFGLNIQPMQGFGIFVGRNVRKVNTFDMPGNVPGETLINPEQYNYYQNTKTKSDWSIGIVLDTNIFNKILGGISAD